MRQVKGCFVSLPFDAGGYLPRPPVEAGRKVKEFVWDNASVIGLGIAVVGLVFV